MKVIAIAGLPSVDLSVPVIWMNQAPGVTVSHEARVFALFYDIVQRSACNPWLLHADMVPVVQAALRKDLASTFSTLFLRLGKNPTANIWGDAHAHYLDPLDKPKFVEFFFQCFAEGRLLILLEDPLLCMEKLLARAWVPTLWEAADVTARHIAAAEQAAVDFPHAVYTFHAGPGRDNWSVAQKLEAWAGVSNPDGLDLLIRMLSASGEASPTDVAAGLTTFDDRLAYWRTELSR